MSIFLDTEYVLLNNKYCDDYGSPYHDMDLAEEECSHDSSCGGVYDNKCDGDNFHLCVVATIKDTSSSDCVHNKTGN